MESQKINTDFRYSHQPYICKLKNIEYLFFCYCESPINTTYGASEYQYMPWKIAYGEWLGNGKVKNVRRLQTRLKAQDIECSPFFYEHEGRVYCSFVAGVFDKEDTCIYNMYAASGDDLNNLSVPKIISKESVFAGFQNQKYQLRNWQELECEIEDLETTTIQTFYPESLDAVNRIISVPSSAKLAKLANLALITGKKDNCHKTLLYDLQNLKAIAEILVDKEPIYKSCLWGEDVVYAKQIGEFEERQLYYSENVVFDCAKVGK